MAVGVPVSLNGVAEKPEPSESGFAEERSRAALRVRIVAREPERATEIRTVLGAISEPGVELLNGDGGLAPDPSYREPADVVMVMLNQGDDVSLGHLEICAHSDPRPALFALISEQSPGLMKRALRAGADEILFMPMRGGDATRALLKVSESRRRSEKRTGGVVCSFTSLAGGCGVTTTAANLALALKYQLKRSVAVVDLDFQAAMLDVLMNVDAEHTIMALSSEKALDSIRLQSALSKHPSGVYLLAAPKNVEDSELVPEGMVDEVLGLLREMFDFVLVDCGHQVNGHAVAAFEKSDQVFYLAGQTIGSARCAWRFIELFKRLRIGVEPQFILGQYQPNYAITAEQIAQTLARPFYAKIPRDDKAIERVEMLGKDLWQVAPQAAVTRSFQDLALRIAEQPGDAALKGGGVVSRLISTLVYRAWGAGG